jgi:hypothetical protein
LTRRYSLMEHITSLLKKLKFWLHISDIQINCSFYNHLCFSLSSSRFIVLLLRYPCKQKPSHIHDVRCQQVHIRSTFPHLKNANPAISTTKLSKGECLTPHSLPPPQGDLHDVAAKNYF